MKRKPLIEAADRCEKCNRQCTFMLTVDTKEKPMTLCLTCWRDK